MNDELEGNLAAALFSRKAAECKTKEEMLVFCENFLIKNKPPSEEDVQNEIKRNRVGEESYLKPDVFGKGTRLSAYRKVDEFHLNSYTATDRLHFEDDMKRELIRMLAHEALQQQMVTFSLVRAPMDLSVRYGAELIVIPPKLMTT